MTITEAVALRAAALERIVGPERRKRASTMFEYLRVLMEGWSK